MPRGVSERILGRPTWDMCVVIGNKATKDEMEVVKAGVERIANVFFILGVICGVLGLIAVQLLISGAP